MHLKDYFLLFYFKYEKWCKKPFELRISKQRDLNLCCSQTFTYICLYSFAWRMLMSVWVCSNIIPEREHHFFSSNNFSPFSFNLWSEDCLIHKFIERKCVLCLFPSPFPIQKLGKEIHIWGNIFPSSVYLLRGYFILLKRNRLFLRVKFIQSNKYSTIWFL